MLYTIGSRSVLHASPAWNHNTSRTVCLALNKFTSSQLQRSRRASPCLQFHTSLKSNMSTHRNRLAAAKSPYLLQHASNPVDWYEWSEEAFERAVAENKPIFLSVGYSACHWCHVLAHESFENEAIANIMNENFINIKVDREERPDVDRLYMTVVQATSGRGGWPMSVWLTPNLAPFFAGTYFPTASFQLLCERIVSKWKTDSEAVLQNAESIIQQLRSITQAQPNVSTSQIDPRIASKQIFDRWAQGFDPIHAGFGEAPKFPSPSMTLNLLLRHSYYTTSAAEKKKAIDMVAKTLLAIQRGGINDHVGKGIARYSVDAQWRLPHFEKMLYDQAQLATYALECSLLVEDIEVKHELQKMAADIVEYVGRDLRSPSGAFYSAEDADSLPATTATEKKEGAFYVWKKSEVESVLGEHAGIFSEYFGIKESGNIDPAHDSNLEFSDQNQLYIPLPIAELAEKHGMSVGEAKEIIDISLAKLKQHRDIHRPRPHLDDKIVTAWNGYMLTALSYAASILSPALVFHDKQGVARNALQMAESLANFVKSQIWDASRRELCRSWREGRGPNGMCEDYAALVAGFLDLYESTGKEEYLLFAFELQRRQDQLFWDEENGGYFATRSDDHRILIRLKETEDGAEPSALSLSVSNLYRLSSMITSQESSMRKKAEKTLASQRDMLERAPHALGAMVAASYMGTLGIKQIIITGIRGDQATENVLFSIRTRFAPNRSIIFIDPTSPPVGLAKRNEVVRDLVDGLSGRDLASLSLPEVRICEGHVCGLPLRGDDLANL